MVALAALSPAQAADHAHMAHGANPYQGLIDATQKCEAAGQACRKHCLDSLKAGDTQLAACLASVEEMRVMVSATNQLAYLASGRLKETAALCRQICLDCKKECDKHAKEHETCKACAAACDDCAKACEKLAA